MSSAIYILAEVTISKPNDIKLIKGINIKRLLYLVSIYYLFN